MKTGNKQLRVIKGARLIYGNGQEIPEDAVIVIEGSRIQEVGRENEVTIPLDAEIIDLGDCTLMPGLMDLHIHLSAYNMVTFKNYKVAQMEVTPPLQLLYTLLHAQMCFEMGFTTLRDMPWITSYGGHNTAERVALREAINAGIVAGPRLLVGGYVFVTCSHLDLTHPPNAVRLPGTTADGPWDLRKLARTQIRTGCDFIKTVTSGGLGTELFPADIRNMTQEELDAVVDEAHAFRRHVACHCFTPLSQKMAVRAGVDTLEHCIYTDDEAIALMKEHNKVIIPTLSNRTDRSIEVRKQMGASDFVLNKSKMVHPYAKETFQRIHQAGIKVAMGTDIFFDPAMGSNAYELEVYVDYGMTPMEAIQTSTQNAAEALGLEKDLGILQPEKIADIIAVEGNPLTDIRILQNRKKIKLVMKEGNIFVDKRSGQERYVIHDQAWGWERI